MNLPEASYETGAAAETMEADQEDEPEVVAKADTEIASTETPNTGERATSQKDDVADGAAVRIGLATLAGAAILTAGIMVIQKWSRGDV